jgi:hypothetical protein
MNLQRRGETMTPTQPARPYEIVQSEFGHWELRRAFLNGSEKIYPFETAADAVKAAVERGLPFYELD